MPFKTIDPGHTYLVEGEQHIHFIKRTDGVLIHNGTTNEELLEVLIDRTEFLNAKFPCIENDLALINMRSALQFFNSRTAKRVTQGVETKDIAHVS